jgi:hypothetical protein
MAKISAGGDREVARWRRGPASADGAPYELVLTGRGRLLSKTLRGDSFTLRRRNVSMQAAGAQAAIWKMERI